MIYPRRRQLVMLNYLLISKSYGEPCGDRTHDHLIKSQFFLFFPTFHHNSLDFI